ncbi:MAG: sulfotransferase family protein [Solirubrobacterales bacterium]
MREGGRSGSSPVGALPNLIGIGAHQCGSSSLHYYLDLHPEIQMSSPKELNFFTSPDDFNPGRYEEELELLGIRVWDRWRRGSEWYASHFSPEAPVRGESSPAYSLPWYPHAVERMASLLPDARLIYVVREPLERAVSNWMRLRALRVERRPLEVALGAPNNLYIARSRYWTRLRSFLDWFPRERIHLIRHEELLLRRREILSEVFAFLGVDASFWDPRMERLRNTTATKGARFRIATRLQFSRVFSPLYRLGPEAKWWIERHIHTGGSRAVERPRVSADLRRRILTEFEPEIAGLEELTGWDLSEWRG